MRNEILSPVKYYSAGHLFTLAKLAYERTKGGALQEPGKSDAIVSIIFSASSLEAFINELPDLASIDIKYSNNDQSKLIKSFIAIMNEIEDSRGSTRLKFLQTHLILAGTSYKTDEPPFQDFSNLFKLRDAFLHLKPQKENATKNKHDLTPKSISGLPKNVLAKFDKKVTANWITMVSTQAAAKWACNTASEMVHSVLRILPETYFGKIAIATYGEAFQPVN
jgi:hypothetical protein